MALAVPGRRCVMDEKIFLTIKDLMILVGYSCYNSAQRYHKTIRKKLGKEKSHKLTIREYCVFEKVDFNYIWEVLRGEKHP